MKLLQLAAALAVTALAAVTPFSSDDTVIAGVETLARRAFVARQNAPWLDPRCMPCTIFELNCVKECKDGDEECYHACYAKMCSVGPEVCHNPRERCAHDLCLDNHAVPRGLTEASTSGPSPRDLMTATGDDSFDRAVLAHYEEALGRRDQDNLEMGNTAVCNQCDDWMKNCKKTQCPRPWAPECQWGCQAKICKDGPPECRKGGACGVHARCGAKSNVLTSPDPPTSLQARGFDPGWDQEECDDHLKGCIDAFCHNPLHQGPNCEKACHNALCDVQAECCKAKPSTSSSSPGSSYAPQVRSDGDGKNREQCDDYIKGCIAGFCHDPLHHGPDCEEVCRNTICETHTECCKAKPFVPSVEALNQPAQDAASPTRFLTVTAPSSSS
ncbi:uncharacterized protein N0V89_005873 [Didymosphaeria variabile]|uniref:Uncharacterized protein n=1 Tax=Didymosphaeria variabile TaxID=1932322 RepID=A0A9W9CBP3_9PLEO|nr:uncharacterized protein N0V89_005873 [Didymosphaeria variabile]KAJ4354140.1 hypothetical protein N0V89_005873 [Didymosphaeria variabile]